MKKETTAKSKLWIWIVIAAVLLLAVGGVVLALVLGQNNGPAADPVSGPRPDLYWNLDREYYTANSQTGLSTREADANGQFKMRFAYNGEIVEYVIIDKKLVNIIDTQDVLGLTFDENGVVIGQTNVRELATEVGKKIYVKKATSDTIVANSSLAMNGMELNLVMGQYAEVYDLRMDSETLGKKLAPTDLQVMDCMTVYANAEGDITHVYLLSNATRSKIYWRANLWISNSINRGGLDPDENGVWTLPFYCDGELVQIKTKDIELVDYYAEMGKHSGFTGLLFDDDGYAIDIMNAAVGIAGQRLVYAMDVVSVDGTTVSMKNNWTTTGAMEWTGTIPEDVPIYDVSPWAYSENAMGKTLSVKDLKVGDRVTIFADLEGNIVEAGITLRRVDLKPMFNNSSKYDTATRTTTRVKDADGYYVFTFIHEGGISKYKTKDERLATFIDSYPERVFGIVTKGEILVKAYEYECIYGYTRFSTALYVDAINGTILSCSDNKKANAYTAVLSEDYKVLDISGDSKEYGTKIKLQENDCMISFRNTNKEVCMIYVTKRAMGGSLYVNTEPNTSRAPVTKDAEGNDIKNPYWEFKMTDVNGKQVTLQLPTGKQDKDGVYANKYLQSRIDSASRGIIALKVSGKTIKEVHAVGNMASGNSVGTVIITKAGTEEFEYKTVALPNDEASIYPGWTGKEGLKMVNISATINKYHGEKLSGGMKVNDVYYMVRNRANDTVALFLYGRGIHNDFYFVKDPQGVINGETIREKNEAGYYVIDVMYQGKLTQVQTKDSKLAAKLDNLRTGAALKLDKSTKPYTFTAVSDYTGTNDAFKSEFSNWDVSAISGNNVTVKLNIPTATTEVGITNQVNISGAKVYNISPNAGNDFGKTTKLQKNDRVRIFSDKNGKITYVLVTVRNGVKTAECEHCGKKVTWNPITATSGIGVGDGHYYIYDSYKVYGQMAIASSDIAKYEVVVDLNGKTVTQDGNNARVFTVAYEGKTLTLLDSVGTGVVEGYGNSANGEAGNANVIQVSYGATVNILSGTYQMITAEGKVPAKQGGVLFSWSEGDYPRNTVNIKGGTIIGGEIKHPARDNGVDPLMQTAFASGGAIYGQMTDFNMSGGTIKDGRADRGGNVYLGTTATFTMTGGTIENGIAKNRGGNFYAATGSKITINGGKVIGGSIQGLEIPYKDETTGEDKVQYTGQQGGNIFGYNVTLKKGEITGGTARTTGGNIFMLGYITETKGEEKVIVESNSFTMTGGKLADGNAPSGGGNIYVYGGEGLVAVSGGEIDASGVTMGPETTTVDGETVVLHSSTLSATGGKIGAVSIGNECNIVVGDDAQIDSVTMNAKANPMSVTALSKNAKIQVDVQGRFGKAAEGAKKVNLEAYANNQIVSVDKRMGNIYVEKDEKGVKWLVAGTKGTVDDIYGDIVEEALKMTADGVFDVAPGAEPAIVEARCPYCKETAQWAPLSEKILKGMTPNDQNSYVLDGHTHYYMAEDITLPTVAEMATRLNATKGTTVCLHLNAKTLDQNSVGSTMGAILVANGSTMTIMGDGNVTGAGLTYTNETLGTLYGGGAIDARGTVNILGGTYKSSRNDRPAVAAFGAAGNGVKINMYAGTITKGAAENTDSAFSSNVRMHYYTQTFNMYGGTIEGGIAENGGNLRMHGGTFNLYGGSITNGTSKNLGGNVCVRGGTFNLIGGSVTGGTCDSSGGSMALVAGTLNISGGSVTGGNGKYGNLVYVYDGKLNITGGELKDGAGATENVRIYGGTNTISGGTISGGAYIMDTGNLTISGDANISADHNGLLVAEGAQLFIGELSENASVAVTATGKFAKAAEGAENVNLAAYANKQIVSTDKRIGTITVETDSDNVKWLAVGAKGTIQDVFGQIVADANKMTTDGVFNVADGAEPAVVEAECPYCMETAQWAPLTSEILAAMTPGNNNNYVLEGHTHYYLAADVTLPTVDEKTTRLNIASGNVICLHLNGKKLDQNSTGSTMGAILVSNGGTLTVMGEGEVTGAGLTYTDDTLGALYSGGAIDARGTVNILGGTYKSSRNDRPAVAAFGAAGNIQINMYAGTITKGAAEDNTSETSSNVRLHHAKHTFNMYGGTIENGKAKNGGNLRMQEGTFNMYGGTITGGTSENLGGNICVRGGSFNLIGGEVVGGTATSSTSSGGSIGLVAGKLNVTGGKISGGTAVNGGLIYVYGGALNISGGELTDGVSTNAGASIRIAGGTNTISGGVISGGVYLQAGCNLTVSGDAKIGAQWSGLQVAEGGELLIGELTKNASIAVTANGKFAKAADEKVNLTSYVGKQIVAAKPDLCTISVVKDDKNVAWLNAANKSLMEVYGPVVDASSAQVFTGTSMAAKCEYCNKTVTWTGITQAMVDTALTTTNGFVLDTAAHTHYFLAEDITMPAFEGKPTRLTTTSGTKSVVCLHLNDKTLDQNAGSASANGVLFVAAGSTMNIMGNGFVIGTGVYAADMYGGALDVRGTANIFGGAYMSSNPDRPAVALFSAPEGAAARDEQLAARVINMFGGAIIRGAATDTSKTGSSNVWLNAAVHVFNMYGGSIENGIANRGGNVRVKNGTFNLYGGTITGGEAANLGGNINMAGGNLNVMGGLIEDGTCASSGGSIGIVAGSTTISGGTISGGQGANGGLIYQAGGTLKITGNAVLENGVASVSGGLVVVGGGNAIVTGGTFANGTAPSGKGINVTSGKTMTMGAVTAAVDVRLTTNCVLNISNGAKANVEFISNTSKLILADDLAEGTAISVAYAADDQAPLSEANAKVAEYVNAGYLVSANPARALKVNAENQIYVASMAAAIEDLGTLLATEVPAGKQYHESYCPVCGALAQWVPLNDVAAGKIGAEHTHYYLKENLDLASGKYQTEANTTTCLFLNGKNLTQTANGVVLMNSIGSTLNIIDTAENKGTVSGGGSSFTVGSALQGIGALDVRGTCNIYGGTFMSTNDKPAVALFAASGATLNMYNGKIVGNAATTAGDYSNNLRMYDKTQTFNMYGGEITGGKATNGANVKVTGGNFNLHAGKIDGGVYVIGNDTKVNINNGAKITSTNGGLTIDGITVTLATNLAEGTEIYVSTPTREPKALTAANAKAADYLNTIVKACDSNAVLSVDGNKQICIAYKSVAELANELSALFATEIPAGKQYHEATCPVCNEVVQWVGITNAYVAGLTPAGSSSDTYYLDAGTATHYYLAENIDMPASGTNPTRFATTGGQITTTCLHLNGKTLDQKTTLSTKMGVLLVGKGTTLNLMDKSDNSGTVIGTGLTASSMYSGALDVRGTANIYGGTYKSSVADRPAVAIFSTSTDTDARLNVRKINMYGGVITKGAATTTANEGSSNVWVNASTQEFNMYGGTIENGMAANGGNVRIKGGAFNLIGGTITGGEATNLGGNVCVRGGVFTMTGGTVKDADITGNNSNNASGGNFGLVSGTLDIQGGVVENGKANNGGLIYVYGGTLKISGGELKNGVGAGGNVLLGGGTNTITGGTITGGKVSSAADAAARDVTVNSGKTLTIGNSPVIGNLYVGGTVTVKNGTVATVELTSAGRIAFADDVAAGTEITVIASATQDIATVAEAANYLTYFKAGVAGATFAVKENTSDTIVMTIPTQG